LRFTTEEATAFLNHSIGLNLSPSDVAALDRHTEGWIAGLQMAAFALQSRIATDDGEGVRRFIDSFSGRHHFILDYLTDEVLDRQPDPVHRFLLHTCILERMCSDLCDAVIGESTAGEASQRILEQLQQANLFIVPLDGERRWYRYHRLFAELLRARLQENEPDRLTELHRAAAIWYDENGLPTEAVHHALAIPDYDLAASVIERAIRQVLTWSSLSTATFMGWLYALPRDVVEAHPWLQLFAARVRYVSGERASAIRTLQELERELRQAPADPDAGQILLLAALDRASYAVVRGDVKQATRLARHMLAELPKEAVNTRMRALSILGLSKLRAGDVRAAERTFSDVIAMARAADLRFAVASFLCNLAEVRTVQAQLRQAIEICREAIELGTVDGQPTQMVAFAHLVLGRCLYQQNDLPAAEKHLSQGLDLLERGQITIGLETGYANLALIRLGQGDAKGAADAIDEAVRVAQRNDIPRLSMLVAAYQARVWLVQGRVDLAARWADAYQGSEAVDYLREFEDVTLARVLLAQDEPARAARLLDPLVTAAEAAGRVSTVIEALVLRALAQQAMGESDSALDGLSRVLALTEPESIVRVFVDHGPPMAELLRAALSRDLAADYVAHLLATFRSPKESPPTAPQAGLPEPLTDREMEVLGCLAEGLSNAEIGHRLFIALPTVKSHTSSIYGKLAVHDRRAAVARARNLGILPRK
jgi:LuxR family maltose regulon positive regulatory protein